MIPARLVGRQEPFRRANERLGTAVGGRVAPGHTVPFLCECGDEDCMDTVSLTLAAYEEIHSHQDRYILVSGHPASPGAQVVGEVGGYSVVESR